MISTLQDMPQPQKIEDLAKAIREQVELERSAQELHARALAQKEEELAAIEEKNRIELMQIDAMRKLTAVVNDLNHKVTTLHTEVMHYTQGYIADHHIPLTQQLNALHARVEVILQFLSALAPNVVNKDERFLSLQSQLIDFLSHPMTGGGIVVNTGDTKLKADGDMSGMNITGK